MPESHPSNKRFNDITGQQFGHLTAIEYLGRRSGCSRWLCRCDCGVEKTYRLPLLNNGHTKSCGCLRLKHGMHDTTTYYVWKGMIQRCVNPNDKHYRDYGGRGIAVCDHWRKFENFLADMGVRPLGRSIDRIDNNGNYEPDNCRWATSIEQHNNTRANWRLTHQGETFTLAEWAKKIGISSKALSYRLKHGWSIELALTMPVAAAHSIRH